MQHHINSPSTSTSCNSAHALAAGEAAASLASYRGARKRRWGKWVAEIREPRKRSRIWLGSYFSAEAAARAFDVASYCLRGSSARMNLPALLPQAVKNLPTLSDPKSVQKVALAVGSMADSVARRTSAPSTSSGGTPPSLVTLNSNVPPLASTVISSSTSTSVTIRRQGGHFPSKRPPRLSVAAAAHNSMAHESPEVDSYSGALSSCGSSSIPLGKESITESLGRNMLDMGDKKRTHTDHVARLDWLEGAKPEFSPKPTIEQIADAMLILPPFPLHAIAEQRCDDDAGVDALQVSDSSLWHFGDSFINQNQCYYFVSLES